MEELIREGGDEGFQVSKLQRHPDVVIRVLVKGVQIHAQGARKQDGILGRKEKGERPLQHRKPQKGFHGLIAPSKLLSCFSPFLKWPPGWEA